MDRTDKIAQYIEECRQMNIKILPPDINLSYGKFTVKDGSIVFGLAAVKNVGAHVVDLITKERDERGPFQSFCEFCERTACTEINKRCVESFIKAGVFGSLGVKRSQLFKTFESIMENTAAAMKNRAEGQVSLFDLFEEERSEPDDSERYPRYSEFSKADLLSMEKEMLGIYLSGHPLEGYADLLGKIRISNPRI